MSDYIKKKDVLECLEAMKNANKNSDDRYIYAKVIQQVEDMTASDAVEVVRCKDCKHRYLSGVGKQYYVCDFLDAELKDNDFCSYGERRC